MIKYICVRMIITLEITTFFLFLAVQCSVLCTVLQFVSVVLNSITLCHCYCGCSNLDYFLNFGDWQYLVFTNYSTTIFIAVAFTYLILASLLQ